MKKPIILSGVAGSGKSHIAEAIKKQHNPINVREINYENDDFPYGKDEQASLVVYDEVPAKELLSLAEDLAVVCPNAQILLMTQERDVSDTDYGDSVYIINCSPSSHTGVKSKKGRILELKEGIERINTDMAILREQVFQYAYSMVKFEDNELPRWKTEIKRKIDKMKEWQELKDKYSKELEDKLANQ